MTIRTIPAPLALDARDFQFTHQGVTVGLKLSYTPGMGTYISSIVIAEKEGGEWKMKEQIAMEFDDSLTAMGVRKWLTDEMLPRLNAWLAKRFAGGSVDNPDPLPAWVPQVMVDLDEALLRLKVSAPSGVPQVEV